MAGAWEFPGGKRHPGERRFDALCRELAEELGITVTSAEPFVEIVHAYADRQVRLDVWTVGSFSGEPAPKEGQPIRWVRVAELGSAGLLPADRPIIDALSALR
jgi:8-oxo-dGTP diphosphatase